VTSDDVLQPVSLMVNNAIRDIDSAEDFLGQLGPKHFILVTGQERAISLQERIRSHLEPSFNYFYPIKDREKSVTRNKRLAFKIGVLQ
jgi:GGDEF domain-containing protein